MLSLFKIDKRGTTVTREVMGGITTFMAMSYIIFVQPSILSAADMDANGVIMATCIAAAIGCVLMGLLANYPIALAPGMGHNAFFAFVICGAAFGLSWQEGLAITLLSGLIFLGLSFVGFRSMLLNSIPDSLKSAIAAGIGLFIALIGLQFGNIITHSEPTMVTLAPLSGNHVALLTVFGLAVTLLLTAWRVPGAVLVGIIATTLLSWMFGAWFGWPAVQSPESIVAVPTGLEKTVGGALSGFGGIWQRVTSGGLLNLLALVFILVFMDLFDTVGTLVGVAKRAGLVRMGVLPRAERALAADAGGTVAGALLGTSTVTSYIESITGVQAGARTGLAAIVAGLLMLLAMFFQPVVRVIGGGVTLGTTEAGVPIIKYPMIAPALIFVGALMVRAVRDVDWDDITEALPAFLTMIVMPLAYSIADGIAIGFISYALAKVIIGKPKQCPLIVHIFAVLFIGMYVVRAMTTE
ncbi:MAG: NCS2 family permease [Phycisphaerae bacterium]